MIRIFGLLVFCVGCYCVILNSLFKVRVYRFGMSCFVAGTAMTLIPMAL